MGLQLGDQLARWLGEIRRQHHERLHLLPALGAGHADHRAFGDRGMRQKRILHFRRADIVARADDHVVAAREVPIIAVGVAAVGVAGHVPAVLDIVALARVIEVAAAGRALDREAADAFVHLIAVSIEDRRCVARHRLAGGARADVVAGRGDEDVHHLGRADAVGDRVFPCAPSTRARSLGADARRRRCSSGGSSAHRPELGCDSIAL